MIKTPTVVLELITMMFIVAFAVPALANTYEPCGSTHTVDLIADGGDTAQVVGAVTVSNDETQVCVDIKIDEAGWWITESNVEVAKNLAGIPQNKTGPSAVPGDFEDVQYFDISDEESNVRYCVDLVNIYGDVSAGNPLVVSAHVKVTYVLGKKVHKVSKKVVKNAWAVGSQSPTPHGSDAFSVSTTVQNCEALPCPCFTKKEVIEALKGKRWKGSQDERRGHRKAKIKSATDRKKYFGAAYSRDAPDCPACNSCSRSWTKDDHRLHQSLPVEVAKSCFDILEEIIY